tara:strand:- start:7510 stop:8823 length:1314 start_codon:yes stop_codon:yes gene_type:complete
MAVFKQFNTNQVVVAPFNANKRFAYSGYNVTASNVGIEYYQTSQESYTSGSNPTGLTTILDGVLVFNSIKQLYYSNYLTSSTGDSVSTGSLVPGAISTYDENVGITTGPRFENFLQSSVTQSRYFSQFSASNGNGPSVISIPSKLFGEVIPPSTFQFEYTSSTNFTQSLVKDDGEGNLMAVYNSGQSRAGVANSTLAEKVGDIFYSQGMAIFTGPDSGSLSEFPSLIGASGETSSLNNNGLSSSIKFSSSIQIRENQYKCVVRDNEYSYTTNPSALRPLGELNKTPNQLSGSISYAFGVSGGTAGVYSIPLISGPSSGSGGVVDVTIASDETVSNIDVVEVGRGYSPNETHAIVLTATGGIGVIGFDLTLSDVIGIGTQNTNETYYDFATGSYFSPYVTTIGLYNESFQLVAVGKLSQPIPISLYTDTTFVVNFDTW